MRQTIIVVIALVGALLSGWAIYSRAGDKVAAQTDSAAAAPTIPVTAGTAQARDTPTYVRGIGSVQAYNTVTVKSRVDGEITKVAFTEGQEVKAGDLLFEIDPRPFQAAVALATANMEKDEAQLVSAQADLKRDTDLLGHGFQTQQAYDQQKALVGQTQASIKADQAQIETAQLNLQYAEIRSPIGGRTGARLVDIGNIVHATDNTGLVTITQLHPIFVSFTAPQNQLDVIRESQSKSPIETQAFSLSEGTQLADGKLTLIDNQVDQATGTIHLKAIFDNQEETLWPGEFVNVRLIVSIHKNAVTVPSRAVQQGPNGDYIFVIKPDDTVELRTVEVEQVDQELAVIAKGLAAGERVVIDGQYRLDQGTRVSVQPVPKPSA